MPHLWQLAINPDGGRLGLSGALAEQLVTVEQHLVRLIVFMEGSRRFREAAVEGLFVLRRAGWVPMAERPTIPNTN